MTITLYRPQTKNEKRFHDLISNALDAGVTLECINNTITAFQDADPAARLAEYRDAETDPYIRDCYQIAIDDRPGGGQ